MRADELLSRLEHETDKKRLDIKRRYADRLSEIRRSHVSDKDKAEKEIIRSKEHSMDSKEKKMMSRARLDQKIRLLEKKKEIIDSLIEKGSGRFLSSVDYDKLLAKMLDSGYVKGMSVIVSKDDSKAKRLLKTKKIKAAQKDMGPGFILESKDRRTDCTFRTYLDDRREHLERMISQQLEDIS